jgi:short-subunit dehydrogenase
MLGGNSSFSDKVVWITGASSGIGKETALQLSSQNTTLILSARNETALKEVAALCEENGAMAEVLLLDLASQESIQSAVIYVLKNYPKIDVVFHNGGLSSRSLVYETPIEVDRKLMEINYFGTMSLTKLLIPRFMEQKSGHFVVTTSIAGVFGFPLRSSYCASKHALHGYFDTVRAELVNYNIDVTIVCPGRIHTDISKHALDKEGNATGKMDDGQKKGMQVDRCVKQMLKATRRKKKEIYIGNEEILMVYFKKYIPSIYYKLASKVKPD